MATSAPLALFREDLADDNRFLADLLTREWPVALAFVEAHWSHLRATHVQILLAAHPDAGDAFLLICQPDGPWLGCQPLTDGAARTLFAGTRPPEGESVDIGAADWAERQRWVPIMGLYHRRCPDGMWESYDPKTGQGAKELFDAR